MIVLFFRYLVWVVVLSLFGERAPLLELQPDQVSLNGNWLFRTDASQVGQQEEWFLPTTDFSDWDTLHVPSFWESKDEFRSYDGWAWYALSFQSAGLDEAMSLLFEGIDDDAVVWLNGEQVGSHSGYNLPFDLELGEAVKYGDNLLVVLVKDHAGGGGIYKSVMLVPTRLVEELLKSKYAEVSARPSADWVRDGVIYELYLRSFSKEGTFEALEGRLGELMDLGVTVVWLMPVHPIGEERRKGTLGSPYSVQDFYAVNPEFGTIDDFRRLVGKVHELGMRIIIDLVVNHTAWDSKLLHEHPEWFTRDAGGNMVTPHPDWTDVADLDYGSPRLRRYMIEMMKFWVRDVGIDGFRCDVSELVPTDFWEDARAALDSIKTVLLVSEGTLPEHHIEAFDLTYSWNIYKTLDLLLAGRVPATTIEKLLEVERQQFLKGSLRMRFTSNHDETAWDAPDVEKYGVNGAKLTAVLVNTIPGIPLLYNGQEVGNRKKLPLFEALPIDWSSDKGFHQFYKSLFDLRGQHPALRRGEFLSVQVSDKEHTLAFLRKQASDVVLVVCNFSDAHVGVKLAIPVDKLFDESVEGLEFKDAFGPTVRRMKREYMVEFPVQLPAKGYKVFLLNPW